MSKAPPPPGAAPASPTAQARTQQGTQAPPGAPPPAPAGGKSPRQTLPSPLEFKISEGLLAGGERIGIYGTGKIGKTELASHLPGGVLFLDLEHGTKFIDVKRIENIRDLPTLRGVLAGIDASPPPGIKTIVVDSLTQVEEMAKDFVVQTKTIREKGSTRKAANIEDFPFGSGWQLMYDEMLALFSDLDRLVDRHGLNICCTAHDCTTPVPNPNGTEFLRYEPRLYGGDKKERGSVRKFWREWLDHLLFVAYDVHVTDDGKGIGAGTRTVYANERPTHLGGSRTNSGEFPFDLTNAAAIWAALGIS